MGGRQRSGRPTQHGGRDPIPDEGLALAREAYERGEWSEAHVRLTTLDQCGSLTADDLGRLSILAYLLGRDDECIDLLVRAYHEHLNNGVDAEAARCACWLGYLLTDQGKAAGGAAWFARGQALIDDGDLDCSALGFLQAATGFAAFAAGEYSAAVVAFDEASTIAARFGDRDLTTLVGLGFGHSLVKEGERARGVAVLDEVMVAVTAGEVSPIMNGLAYCAVIDVCQEIFDLRRAREWTAELARWCDAHPDLTPFRGQCLVHRAEIMQHHGAWVDALEEAEAARQRLSTPVEQPALGLADYRRGELHRLRGEFTEAEDAYNHARRWGHSAQPGLALLWLAMGRTQEAAVAVHQALAEAEDAGGRARVLAAHVEIALAVDDVTAARRSVGELAEIAAEFASPLLDAVASRAHGWVLLAEGDAVAADIELRRTWEAWQELEAPYEAARTRELIGLARRAQGDETSARMELEAAGWVYRRLGADPDLRHVDQLMAPDAHRSDHELTRRETEVLRMVAEGLTNKAIATELFLSERTVDRHVSNLLAKLGVSSRTAATAYAYQHGLV